MSDDAPGRSPELEQVRRLLFPDRPAEDGWAAIDEAFARASDPQRVERIERLAEGGIEEELLRTIARVRGDEAGDER